MNHKTINIFLIIILAAVIAVSCNKGGKWAVKINNDVVSIDEYNDFYYTQNKILLNMDREDIDKLSADMSMINHPTLNKTKFMDFLVSRKLLFQKAMKDDSINKDELKTVIELFKLQGVATYYLSEKLKDEIVITDDEVDNFYNSNRRMFKGVPVNDQVIAKIKQQIFMQKFEQKSSEFVMNLIAESKVNREGFKNYMRESAKEKAEKAEEKKETGK